MENCTTFNLENPKKYVKIGVFKFIYSVKIQEITCRHSIKYRFCVYVYLGSCTQLKRTEKLLN